MPWEDMPYVLLRLDAAGLARLQTFPGLVRITAADTFNWRRDFVQLRLNARMSTPSGTSHALPADGPDVVPFIVGGTDADPATHPFQVGLLDKSETDNFEAQFCGGTLVAERFVVTAAHCSDDILDAPGQVEVLVGTQRLDGSGQRIGVARVHVHPRWTARNFDYDVAVWELAAPVTGHCLRAACQHAAKQARYSLEGHGLGKAH